MKNFLLIILFLLLPVKGFAQVSITAHLTTSQASLEDEVELIIKIEGSQSEPQLPSMPGFKVIPRGTSSSIQIINGNMSMQKTYRYVLIPTSIGEFTIPPITIADDGKTYTSQENRIKIVDQPMPPKSAVPPGVYLDDPRIPRQSNQSRQNLPYWIEAFVSNKSPYLGEQIIFTFRFYTSVQVGKAVRTLPDFHDFSFDELDTEKKGEQIINGQRYVMLEKIGILVPKREGRIVLGQSELRVEVPDEKYNQFQDPFNFGFGGMKFKVKNLKANGQQIDVKPLPLDPENTFFTGLVGNFEIEANLKSSEVKQNETLNYEIIIKGEGNIKDAVIPQIKFPESFKVYEDNPEVKISKTETGYSGTKKFLRALVPIKAGDFEIPETVMSYFDPASASYVKLVIPSKRIHVIANQEQESISLAQKSDESHSVNREASLAPLTSMIETSTVHMLMGKLGRFMWIMFLIPPMLYLGILVYKNNPFQKLLRNKARSLYRLKSRLHKINQPINRENAKLVEGGIREYFESKFDAKGSALTTHEMRAILESKGISRDLVVRFDQIINELQVIIYSQANHETGGFNMQDLFSIIESIDSKANNKNK